MYDYGDLPTRLCFVFILNTYTIHSSYSLFARGDNEVGGGPGEALYKICVWLIFGGGIIN